jgi:hypothetical protein
VEGATGFTTHAGHREVAAGHAAWPCPPPPRCPASAALPQPPPLPPLPPPPQALLAPRAQQIRRKTLQVSSGGSASSQRVLAWRAPAFLAQQRSLATQVQRVRVQRSRDALRNLAPSATARPPPPPTPNPPPPPHTNAISASLEPTCGHHGLVRVPAGVPHTLLVIAAQLGHRQGGDGVCAGGGALSTPRHDDPPTHTDDNTHPIHPAPMQLPISSSTSATTAATPP